MIDAKELRIGNWLQFNQDDGFLEYVQVTQIIHESFVSEGDEVFHNPNIDGPIEPIPLTPDILHKSGFENHQHNENELIHISGFKLAKYGDDLVLKVLDQIVNYTPIKYVHEIQNIYHSLCRQELQINL